MKNIQCVFCNHQWQAILPLSKREECPHCGRDARICLNCKNYDESRSQQCKETQTEPPKDKESANHCDEFSPANFSIGRSKDLVSKGADSSLNALEELFRKK